MILKIFQMSDRLHNGRIKPRSQIDHVNFVCRSIENKIPFYNYSVRNIIPDWEDYIVFKIFELCAPSKLLNDIINIKNHESNTILYTACKHAEEYVIRVIMNCKDINITLQNIPGYNCLLALFLPCGRLKTINEILKCFKIIWKVSEGDKRKKDDFYEIFYNSYEAVRPFDLMCNMLGNYNPIKSTFLPMKGLIEECNVIEDCNHLPLIIECIDRLLTITKLDPEFDNVTIFLNTVV